MSSSSGQRVYDLNGILRGRYENPHTVDLSDLPSGIYAVQFNTDNSQTTGSALIRF